MTVENSNDSQTWALLASGLQLALKKDSSCFGANVAHWLTSIASLIETNRTLQTIHIPKTIGIGRMFDNDKALLLILDAKPTDAQINAIKERLDE